MKSHLAGADPQVHRGKAQPVLEQRFAQAHLVVELERPGVYDEGARRRPRLGRGVHDPDPDAQAHKP
jgi:hypothetical protein